MMPVCSLDIPLIPPVKATTFTLIELLVVIAIIGILVSMLLPGLRNARESARGIQCMNNVRQLGMAINAYDDDNNEVIMPGWFTSYSVPGLYCFYLDRLVQVGYLSSSAKRALYFCPSDTKNMAPYTNYGTYKAGGVMYVDLPGYVHRNTELRDPANTCLLSEGYSADCWSMTWPVDGTNPNLGVQFFHNIKANVLLADSAVRTMHCPLPSPWANVDGVDGLVFWNWNNKAYR